MKGDCLMKREWTWICSHKFILWSNYLLCTFRQLLLKRQWSYTVRDSVLFFTI